MEQRMHTGGVDSDAGISSSESSLFPGGRLPAVWFGDDTDDGSLSSFDTSGKASDGRDFKSTRDSGSESPAVSKDELEHSQEVGSPTLSPFAPRYHLGEAYEVHGSAGFILHQIGHCFPCLYHTQMGDGSRRGDACDHCHLCTRGEARTRRNRIHLEAQKRANAKRRALARAEATRESKGSDS
ncbi:unnamed protein product [Symbiodinium necroappetens]|uniref:Uncharacterized protein n=1 Tax=Symbiodinium necroappetens TaxID=1628268 RepID=A0A813CEK6_9DINO|nr:unnamed protein product [Symbiodinium necroappetens]